MPKEDRMFTPNLVIGVALMGLGIALLLDRLGLAVIGDLLKYWPVLLVLFGASVAVQALRPKDPSVPPQRPLFSPGFVLIVVIVAMLGSQGFRVGRTSEGSSGDDHVNLFGVMGSARQASSSPNFKSAQVGGVMGRTTLDLRRATIAPGEEATVNVFVAMGRATILVPEGWTVDASALPVMGAVEDERWPRLDPSGTIRDRPENVEAGPEAAAAPPRLVLRGFVMMGKVEIQS
jgi:hypothetical protein